jgi:uncharacterized protein (DUF305 family)
VRTRRSVVAVSIAALAVGALTGCSSSTADTTSPSPGISQTAADAPGSATDIAFAQSMIPHHEQAIAMADLALSVDSGASQQVRQLAEQIKAAQDPEIEQMTQWLQGWGVPTAMPGATDGSAMAGMDHSGHDMGGMTVAGMMTAEEMQALRQASGRQFDQMWLSMMIDHHEGAIAMAGQSRSTGNPQVKAMADAIVAAQQEEIAAMKALSAGGQ